MNTYSFAPDTTVVNVPATVPPQRYPVRLTGLSDEARDYLRRQVRAWRREGSSAQDAANRATSWACGYRHWAKHPHENVRMASAEFVDGYEFAHGEEMYLTCMAVDAAQETPGYGW